MQSMFRSQFSMSPVVKVFLFINVAIYLLQTLLIGGVPSILAGHPPSSPSFTPIGIITSMFVHAGLLHILLNMIVLVQFGPLVERNLGTKRFLIMYFAAGIVGYALHMLVSPSMNPVVGASGCVYGVVTAYALFKPRESIVFIFFPFRSFPLYGLLSAVLCYELLAGIFWQSSGIGHFAHIGGALVGFILTFVYVPRLRDGLRNMR